MSEMTDTDIRAMALDAALRQAECQAKNGGYFGITDDVVTTAKAFESFLNPQEQDTAQDAQAETSPVNITVNAAGYSSDEITTTAINEMFNPLSPWVYDLQREVQSRWFTPRDKEALWDAIVAAPVN